MWPHEAWRGSLRPPKTMRVQSLRVLEGPFLLGLPDGGSLLARSNCFTVD